MTVRERVHRMIEDLSEAELRIVIDRVGYFRCADPDCSNSLDQVNSERDRKVNSETDNGD
jgi:hypothetical protein